MALLHLGGPNYCDGYVKDCRAYLYRYNKFHWVCTIPAAFISTVCFTYLAYNKIGFGLDYQLSVYIGLGLTVLCLVLFFTQLKPLGDRDEEAYVNN